MAQFQWGSNQANQGAPYDGYRQAPSTLPGYSPYAPRPSTGAVGFAAAQQAYAASPPEPIEDAGIRPGEVRAYRCWSLKLGFLRSMAIPIMWAPGEPMVGKVEGQCGGVHAWKSLSKALTYAMPYAGRPDYGGGTIVMGRVDLWGDIVEHENGYRAEFAAIWSLDSVLGADKNDKQMLETLRERYGI